MKAAIVYGDGTLKIEDVPPPQPNEYQALAKMDACASCNSTDRKIIDGKLAFVSAYPAILGHESVGTVVEAGAKVRNFETAARYFRPTAIYVGDQRGPLASGWGGFAEYGLLTDNQAMIEDGAAPTSLNAYANLHQRVPDGTGPADATMMITLKEVLDNIQNFGVNTGRPFVVFGPGAVGNTFVLLAKLLGAYPVVSIGRRDESLERARKFGADVTINNTKEDVTESVLDATGGGADAVIDAVGNMAFLSGAPALLAPGGRLGIYGIDSSMEVKLDLLGGPSSWSLVRVSQNESRVHDQLCAYVDMGAIRLSDFYDLVVPLDDLEKGFNALAAKKAFKVVATMAD